MKLFILGVSLNDELASDINAREKNNYVATGKEIRDEN